MYKPAHIMMQVQEHKYNYNQIRLIYKVNESSPELIVQDGDEEVWRQMYIRPLEGDVV